MNLDDAADIATIFAAFGTLVLAASVWFAFKQYKRGLKAQRAQWLVGLFEKFYENDAYREVRGLIQGSEKNEFLSKTSEEEEHDLTQKWTDYLNFFELVAYLEGIGELTKQDVDAMFKYWIDRLRPFEDYLEEYDYEGLVKLLGRRGPPEE